MKVHIRQVILREFKDNKKAIEAAKEYLVYMAKVSLLTAK